MFFEMALGRQGDRQVDLVMTWKEMPRSPGHVFCDRLQGVLIDASFDAFADAEKMGASSIPPGRYFRMYMVGYFEGICSERGIEWRCADSLSLREFLRLRTTERVPDHSWLSKTRSRLPKGVHEKVFGWVLARIAEDGLVNGRRIGNANRNGLRSAVGKQNMRQRAQIVERSFPHTLARGGMWRT